MPCAALFLPTATYHTIPAPITSSRQRRAHRVRILMLRGVEESLAIKLAKKRGSAWQPLSSRTLECREAECMRELIRREVQA